MLRRMMCLNESTLYMHVYIFIYMYILDPSLASQTPVIKSQLAARLESGRLALLHVKAPYSSAYSSELRLVHTASQPSSLSRVYTVFYWLPAPSRAEDASFIINSCKPSFERRV